MLLLVVFVMVLALEATVTMFLIEVVVSIVVSKVVTYLLTYSKIDLVIQSHPEIVIVVQVEVSASFYFLY